MRIFSAILLCGLLTGCGSMDGDDTGTESAASANADDGKLDCALEGATEFKPVCQVERVYNQNEIELIFRHPDGGFRRFSIVPGKGVEVADGAEQAVVTTIASDEIEVQVGSDRYHLPATIQPGSGQDTGAANDTPPA